jgi:ribonuclease T1
MAGLQLQERRVGVTRLVRGVAASVLGVGLLLSSAAARESRQAPADGLPTVELKALPRQAQQTHALILAGGPFPYAKDGTVFGNRERLLPRHARGYYREYTVKTPGARNRGARRLVCGGTPPTAPAACYYTEDHYASFRRVLN